MTEEPISALKTPTELNYQDEPRALEVPNPPNAFKFTKKHIHLYSCKRTPIPRFFNHLFPSSSSSSLNYFSSSVASISCCKTTLLYSCVRLVYYVIKLFSCPLQLPHQDFTPYLPTKLRHFSFQHAFVICLYQNVMISDAIC